MKIRIRQVERLMLDFTRLSDGISIAVNPCLVKVLAPVDGGTEIRFGQGRPITVSEPYYDVRTRVVIAQGHRAGVG